MIKNLALVTIAICALAHTISIYESEDGGTNIYFGGFGYHIAGAE